MSTAVEHLQTILYPTDFSDGSAAAFRLACSLARDHGARVIVLHVSSLPDLAYQGYGIPGAPLQVEAYLAEIQQKLQKLQPPDARLPVEYRLEEGDPVTEILRVAVEIHANLVVLGTHGQTGLRHLLMGSVAEQVVRQAPCAVLTLRTA